ncbi:glycine receptor subunit alpha-2-like [Eriocheir sinensis]|uniref:glycine receptor subunit alpha-2-like n=1 Tax=Eriocheir sinensis TaxID=95602 RepID=UPI0021C86220|nr:glycine receptor subunit alpha-2-like [Eriocheir sinensis]
MYAERKITLDKKATSCHSPVRSPLLLPGRGVRGQRQESTGDPGARKGEPRNLSSTGEGTWSSYTPPDYRKEIFPPVTPGQPLQVGVSVQVRNLPKIDEEEGLVELEVNLRVRWRDRRLRPPPTLPPGDYLPLDPAFLARLWVPDLFIEHSGGVSTPSLLTQIASVWIYGNATVDYSGNMYIRVSCAMTYVWFPHDHQICLINMQSYAYTLERNVYLWISPGLEVAPSISSEQFLVRMEKVESANQVVDAYGTYPALAFRIHLTRRLSSVLLQLYLPSGLFVVVSFVSFLVPPDAIPGRMTLCITTILTMSTLLGVAMQSTPRVSYVRAIDVWLLACLAFTSLVLLEFGAVIRLLQLGKEWKNTSCFTSTSTSTSSPSSTKSTFTTTAAAINSTTTAKISGRPFSNRIQPHPQPEQDLPLSPSTSTPTTTKVSNPYQVKANRVEAASAILLPGAFLLFNLAYWSWFMIGSHGAIPTFMMTTSTPATATTGAANDCCSGIKG